VDGPDHLGGHEGTAVERAIHEDQVAGLRLSNAPRGHRPLGPLPQSVHRAGKLRETLRRGAAQVGQGVPGYGLEFRRGQRAHLEWGGLHQIGGVPREPHPRGTIPDDLERTAVRQEARAAVHGPHPAGVGGGQGSELEVVGMTLLDEVLVQPELTLDDPDVRGRPPQQIDDEGGRLLQTRALGQVREGEPLRRPCSHRPLAYGRPPTF
jgi:hypothetical protein